MQRGRERFEIFCSACHGLSGHGDGMIVRRGYRKAASFHDDRLRQAPVGHFFDVITNGWGAMPSYAPQVPVQDRWAIIAYIRALQAAEPKEPFTAPIPTGSPQSPSSQSTPASGGRVMSTSFNPPSYGSFQRRAFIAGGVLLVLMLVALFINPAQFFRAYLI